MEEERLEREEEQIEEAAEEVGEEAEELGEEVEEGVEEIGEEVEEAGEEAEEEVEEVEEEAEEMRELPDREAHMEEAEEEYYYESVEDIPDIIRDVLPDDAQELYLEAYQQSWNSYDERQTSELSRQSVAHRDGMAAVMQEYTYFSDTGDWYAKGEEPEEIEAEEADEGFLESLF
jgi:cation transport regulator ChaB